MCCTGSGSPKKNWPADRFVELARRAAADGVLNVFYLLGEADRGIAVSLARIDPARPALKEASLRQVASVLSACRLYIGNDSGITHLAAAAGAPVVALFGPSDPSLWAPRSPRAHLVRSAQPSAASLAEVSVDEVFAACRAVFAP